MKEGNVENDFIKQPTTFSYRNNYHFNSNWRKFRLEAMVPIGFGRHAKKKWIIQKTLCKCEYLSHKCTHIILLHIKLVPSKHYWKKPSFKQKQKWIIGVWMKWTLRKMAAITPSHEKLRIHTQATTIDCIYYISLQNGYLLT